MCFAHFVAQKPATPRSPLNLALDVMNPHIHLLREFADGAKHDVREPERIDAAMWLHENGYIAGAAHRPLSGTGALLNARITALGYDLLQQESEKLKTNYSRESAYHSKYPIRAGIVIAVAGGLLLAAVLAYFAFVSHGI